MSHKYPLIAAAVAAAFASTYADAIPTLVQAASPAASLVISGSSAAQSGLFSAIEANLCGGAANALVVKSAGGSANFLAVSCALSTAVPGTPGIPANSIVTIYYRTEGGSVVGALPIVAAKQIKRLNLADTTCAAVGNTGTCTVNGTTSTSGTVDGWTGAVTEDTVQLGVTDVEPAQLTNLDYPSNYSAAAFGTATAAQLATLSAGSSKLFQQVFGLAVNTMSGSGLPTGTVAAGVSSINLSKAAAANILQGNYTDWSQVAGPTGAGIASSTSHITRIDREPGSGTRTSTNMYFLSYQCGSATGITNIPGEQLNYSTHDELAQANGIPGAIAYTSIDQILNPSNAASWTNLALVQINGTAPSTLNAASGLYDFWFEATLVPNSAVGTNTTAGNLVSYIQTNIPKLANAPASPDVNVIANVAGNASTVPLTINAAANAGTSKAVYVNPYTRGLSSCNVPAETNE